MFMQDRFSLVLKIALVFGNVFFILTEVFGLC